MANQKPPEDLSKKVAEKLREIGLRSAARTSGLDRQTLLAVAHGLAVHRGTLLLVEQWLGAK